MNVNGLESFVSIIDYFFFVLLQCVELIFSNWILAFTVILFIFAIVFDLFEILKGKK